MYNAVQISDLYGTFANICSILGSLSNVYIIDIHKDGLTLKSKFTLPYVRINIPCTTFHCYNYEKNARFILNMWYIAGILDIMNAAGERPNGVQMDIKFFDWGTESGELIASTINTYVSFRLLKDGYRLFNISTPVDRKEEIRLIEEYQKTIDGIPDNFHICADDSIRMHTKQQQLKIPTVSLIGRIKYLLNTCDPEKRKQNSFDYAIIPFLLYHLLIPDVTPWEQIYESISADAPKDQCIHGIDLDDLSDIVIHEVQTQTIPDEESYMIPAFKDELFTKPTFLFDPNVSPVERYTPKNQLPPNKPRSPNIPIQLKGNTLTIAGQAVQFLNCTAWPAEGVNVPLAFAAAICTAAERMAGLSTPEISIWLQPAKIHGYAFDGFAHAEFCADGVTVRMTDVFVNYSGLKAGACN